MHVVFYNVENLFDTEDDTQNRGDDEFTEFGDKLWDTERFTQKIDHLALSITQFNQVIPAIIGLAEIENKYVLEQLIASKHLIAGNYSIVHFESDDPRGMDCAMLVNQSVYSIETTKLIRVLIDDEPYFRTRDIVHTFGYFLGEPLHCFVNHWPSRKEGANETKARRTAAARLLRKDVDQLLQNDRHANILIMGDFNDTPIDPSLYEVLRAKGQHEQKPGDLINLLIEEENKDLGTHVHRGDWMVFDQLIVSQGLLQGKSGLEVKDNNAFIFKHENLLFTYPNGTQKPNASYGGDQYHGGYSDHLPVYLVLKKST